MSPQEKKLLLEKLEENAGYLLLQGILQEQVDQLQREILFTVCSTEEMSRQAEYKKGQLEGRLVVEELRKIAIENLKIDIERSKKNGRSDDDGTGGDSSGTGTAP